MEQTRYQEALQRGQKVRNLQDEILALFVKKIQGIDEAATLEKIKKELQDNA